MYLQRWHGWCHMELLPSQRVLCTPYNHAPCHLMQSQCIRKVHACLAVAYHLHFWQNDWMFYVLHVCVCVFILVEVCLDCVLVLCCVMSCGLQCGETEHKRVHYSCYYYALLLLFNRSISMLWSVLSFQTSLRTSSRTPPSTPRCHSTSTATSSSCILAKTSLAKSPITNSPNCFM